jgi:hypothetical protein
LSEGLSSAELAETADSAQAVENFVETGSDTADKD